MAATRSGPLALAALVRAARAGDRSAFARLVRRERAALVMAARAVLGDFDEAEDCAQEALVEAWRHLGDLRDVDRFRGWLYRILVRVARRRARRAARTRPAAVDLDALPAPAPRVPHEGAARLRAEVGRLPAAQRRALSLFYLAGLSQRETAEVLDVSEARVKSRLYEARRRLERRLGRVRI